VAKPPKVRASSTVYSEALDQLRAECPAYVEDCRWRQCIADAETFIAVHGRHAEPLGWTSGDFFGPPANPHPSYSRLSRPDHTGLAWVLEGRRVAALSSTVAAIEMPSGGILKYRKVQ
jgi:hypothetical protein